MAKLVQVPSVPHRDSTETYRDGKGRVCACFQQRWIYTTVPVVKMRDMKKKTEKRDQSQRQPTNTFRADNAEEQELLERISSIEGHGSIASWAYDLAKRRAAYMEKNLDEGTYFEIRGNKVPVDEVPGADPNEARLVNAASFLAIHSLINDVPDEDLGRVVHWLVSIHCGGTTVQKAKMNELVSRLPQEWQHKFEAMVDLL